MMLCLAFAVSPEEVSKPIEGFFRCLSAALPAGHHIIPAETPTAKPLY